MILSCEVPSKRLSFLGPPHAHALLDLPACPQCGEPFQASSLPLVLLFLFLELSKAKAMLEE